MSREAYIWRNGQLWLKGTEPERIAAPRSDLAAPSIRPDGMGAIRSMADGQVYDGRSAYYDSVKRAGCEIVGDDKSAFDVGPREYKPEGVGQDIKRVIEELS